MDQTMSKPVMVSDSSKPHTFRNSLSSLDNTISTWQIPTPQLIDPVINRASSTLNNTMTDFKSRYTVTSKLET